MNVIWRGGWIGRARILSGLVLFAFALTHFLNHAVGLVSVEAMEAVQHWRTAVTRSLPVSLLLAAALVIHAALAVGWLATRRSFRIPPRQVVQTVLGLAIPLLLLPHVVETRGAAEFLGVHDLYGYALMRLWSSTNGTGQILLLLVVWVHGCMGLHYWLRDLDWWRNLLPLWAGLAALVPAFAIAGFLDAGSAIAALVAAPEGHAALAARLNLPDARGEAVIWLWSRLAVLAYLAVLAAAVLINLLTRIAASRRKVEITFAEGPRVTGIRGMTLLEIAESNRVPMVALCHGKGRCSTCRVVIERGEDSLPPPEGAEEETLRAVGAPANNRLACQIRP
ncbi:MAG: (2Fe-2S)-binding protein, partial [Alphaproteobacteria bacterium]